MSFYQKKFLISIGVTLVVMLGLVGLIIYPALRQINQIKVDISNEKDKLERKLNLGLNLKNIQRDLASIENEIGQLDHIFIAENHELEFITTLENLASKNQIMLNINPDFTITKEDSTKIKTIPVQLNISGSYNQILKFLQDVETLPYYYNVDLAIASNRSNSTGQPMTLQ